MAKRLCTELRPWKETALSSSDGTKDTRNTNSDAWFHLALDITIDSSQLQIFLFSLPFPSLGTRCNKRNTKDVGLNFTLLF